VKDWYLALRLWVNREATPHPLQGSIASGISVISTKEWETCYAHRTPWYCFDFGIVLRTHTLSRQHELRQGGYRSLPATNLTPSRLYRLSGRGTGLPFVIEGVKEKTSRGATHEVFGIIQTFQV